MPLGAGYVDTALDAIVASWPSTGAEYRLYASDPTLAALPGDVELTSDGGYAGVAFAPADFASASGNAKPTTAPIVFPTPTDAWSDVATFWGIIDGSDALVYSNDLDTPIAVDEAGADASFTPTLSFADGQ